MKKKPRTKKVSETEHVRYGNDKTITKEEEIYPWDCDDNGYDFMVIVSGIIGVAAFWLVFGNAIW